MITEHDIIAAIRAARPSEETADQAITTRELADVLGLSVNITKERVRVALQRGVIKLVDTRRAGIDGRVRRVPGWTAP